MRRPAASTIPPGAAWQEIGKGFKYKDTSLAPDGVQKVLLKEGDSLKAKIIVKGKGTNLAMPNLATLASPLTVQLKRGGSSVCWGAVYSFPSQRLGYCRVDFSDENNTLNFNDLTGQKGLIGTTSPGQNPGDVYGSWESPDKKMLVIGDRTGGVVELEFNLLLGDKPKP